MARVIAGSGYRALPFRRRRQLNRPSRLRQTGRCSRGEAKETGTTADWRTETSPPLDAIALAINSTVVLADGAWRNDIAAEIRFGQSDIRSSETISDLFSALSAALARIVFTQISQMPNHALLTNRAPLTPV